MRRLGTLALTVTVGAIGWWPAAPARSEPVAPQSVVVRIHHSRFVPGRIRLPAGSWVRFVVRNDDPIDHEFLVGDDAFQLRHEKGTETHHPPRPGEVSVPANSVAETTMAFGAPARIWYGCHLPGHWAYGMQGALALT